MVLSRLDSNDRAQVLKEAECLQSLYHHNIVAYAEHFEENNTLYLVMEFVDGGDLDELIKQQGDTPLSEDAVLRFFLQIAEALHYLHSRHKPVIHRDVKPSNIFVTAHGELKLGDVGVSTVLQGTAAMTKTFAGTALYIAPEILNEDSYGTKVDIWSLGIGLFEMMVRKPLFTGKGFRLQQSIVDDPYPPLPHSYSAELRDVVERCLKKDPRDSCRHHHTVQPAVCAKCASPSRSNAPTRSPPNGGVCSNGGCVA